MELVRGKSGRVITVCKGLPYAYNRDLQEDQEPVFDSVRAILGMLEVSAEFAMNITFNRERMQKPSPAGFLDATTLVDYLVKKGVPFRMSHEIAGKYVALWTSKNCQLLDLSLDELNPIFDNDVYEFLGVENSIEKFVLCGSTRFACVAEQIDYWNKKREVK
ncbi:unnamed protein product [Lathyrus oleraceus]